MPARVASADETSACERETIHAGTPSAELMRRAGNAAADFIRRRFPDEMNRGVAIYTGPGNNGGDGWVVAESLALSGVKVSVIETGEVKSAEAVDARDRAIKTSAITTGRPDACGLAVDALLGTGSTGAPRGAIAAAVREIEGLRTDGKPVVALDLPSGLDASTGAHDGALCATATVTFGVVKRGHLIARDICGEIEVEDIGLLADGTIETLPALIDSGWVASRVPAIASSAHKGTRRRLAVVGGGKAMAGAAILAGEGALRSGIGLLRIVCAEESEVSMHVGIPQAIVHTWPRTAEALARLVEGTDCIALGPGLGKSPATRDLVERIALAWKGPIVLDADALNVFANDSDSLVELLRGRPAVLTPHPAEMARLLELTTDSVLRDRFDVGRDLAARSGATILLKGSPTIIFSPRGERFVVASGTAALATGGSGDVLTGIVATLLAQMNPAESATDYAAACGAYVHGRASELCGFVRGITLGDVLHALPIAWNETPKQMEQGVIAELASHR